jgi:HPt (histidine-containing phosphotransfer) domain-containing protein
MSDFEQMMAELQVEYLTALPQRLIQMAEQLAVQNVSALREEFHKLKGTGKTYGLPEISELCEVAERICLERPQHVADAVPRALNLLRQIHKARINKSVVSLAEQSEFSQIKKCLS